MFISNAFATEVVQDAAAAAPSEPSFLLSLMPLLVIFALFYILIIRPQSKRMKEHQKIISELSRGDKIITGGGLYGTVVSVADNDIVVEIASGVHVRAQRHTITGLHAEKASDTAAAKTK